MKCEMNIFLKKFGLVLGLSATFIASSLAQANKPLYENNLEKTPAGPLPEEFLVLEGGFEVKEADGNKFIELPGAPLDTFGLLFGPTEKENVEVSARILGTSKGRRFPTFAIGAGGQGGCRLQLAPAKKAIEISRGELLKATVPFDWQTGKWTFLKLQVRKIKDGSWKAEGKAWTEGGKEPENWLITFEDSQQAPSGRSSVWGSPFAGTPIRFDDLRVARTLQN